MEQAPKVEVDLGELRSFAEMLRADAELGLAPGAARAESELQHGARFGLAAVGGQLAAGREVFAAALERARENTARQVRGARILTAAIEQVLANYADGDQIAASRLAHIESTLSEAVNTADAAAQPSPARPGLQP
ncbi:hypothetical protein [Allorhizocola rhizosphaerae]|uniref:hypothetical protein n=1 Tax=Allorhizocola rhizosphaerae TaxID=1872709 RepID=UPI000E3C87E6|nr:hypothetical protein [Allorhizocola rhizosphaerae]